METSAERHHGAGVDEADRCRLEGMSGFFERILRSQRAGTRSNSVLSEHSVILKCTGTFQQKLYDGNFDASRKNVCATLCGLAVKSNQINTDEKEQM